MNKELVKEVLNEAEKYLKDPDILVDVYDESILWVSDKVLKITGVAESEVVNKPSFSFLEIPPLEALKLFAGYISKRKGTGEYVVKTKKGRWLMKTQYQVFEYQSIHYYVGKLISHKAKEQL